MKKKIFLILTMIAIFALTLALGVSAATYKYYENEVSEENLLYTAETMIAKDFGNSEAQVRFESIREESGVGFAKADANGNPLSWYVVSHERDDSGVSHIVVKSALTVGGVGTVDENGAYTYGGGTVSGITSKQIVSANFFGTGVKTLPNSAYRADVTAEDRAVVGTTHASEYCCVAAPGSYLHSLYLPKTLKEIPSYLCYRSGIRVLEFEDNSVEYTAFPNGSFSFCGNLKSLTIPEGITSLSGGTSGDVPFRECVSIEYIEFPDSLTFITENAFFRCSSVKTVKYGKYTTYIGRLSTQYTRFGFGETVNDNVNLKHIYVPNTIDTMSYFDNYRGAAINNTVGVVNTVKHVVFFFGGTLEEAESIATSYTESESHFKVALGLGTKSNSYKASEGPIDYKTYLSDPTYYDNLDGHLVVYDYNECINHEVVKNAVVMENPLSPFVVCDTCYACGERTNIEEYDSMFECKGYSVSENGYDALMVGFIINESSIAAYKEFSGNEISFGLFAAKSAKLGNNSIFNESGSANTGALAVDMSRSRYAEMILNIKDINTYAKRSETLIMGGYFAVSDGEGLDIFYMQVGEASEGDAYSTVCCKDFLTDEQSGALTVTENESGTGADYIIDAGALFG